MLLLLESQLLLLLCHMPFQRLHALCCGLHARHMDSGTQACLEPCSCRLLLITKVRIQVAIMHGVQTGKQRPASLLGIRLAALLGTVHSRELQVGLQYQLASFPDRLLQAALKFRTGIPGQPLSLLS